VPLVFTQPGHWLGPVTGLGWLGPAQSMWAVLGPAPKFFCCPAQFKKKYNKKIKIKGRKIKNKKYVCMDKNNVNLLVYSLTPESGIKYRFKFILFLFVVFYFI
jgi:hypothetical protein